MLLSIQVRDSIGKCTNRLLFPHRAALPHSLSLSLSTMSMKALRSHHRLGGNRKDIGNRRFWDRRYVPRQFNSYIVSSSDERQDDTIFSVILEIVGIGYIYYINIL